MSLIDLFQSAYRPLKSVDKLISAEVKFSPCRPTIIGDPRLSGRRYLEGQPFLRKWQQGAQDEGRNVKTLTGPTIGEEALGVPRRNCSPKANKLPSIHETVFENDGDPITLIDQIADETQERWFDKLALNEAIGALTERERLIVYLRYYRDQTQSEVASRLGISQVQVSRLEKKILANIREQIAQ
jgi:RNA polymerase sporulation-specific sigma factor